jgi:cytochrome c-type biogenesis protein CcsB
LEIKLNNFRIFFQMPINIQVYLANFSFCTLFISMIFYWIETSQFGKSLSGPTIKGPPSFINNPPKKGFYGQSPLEINGVLGQKESRIQANSTDGISTQLVQKSNNFVLNPSSLSQDLDFSNNSFFKGSNFGIILMILSNLSIFTILILRWNESGHFPLSNLYESLMFLSWSLTFLHICIELAWANLPIQGTLNVVYNLLKPGRKNDKSLSVNLAKNSTKKKIFLTKLIGSITSPCALFTNAFASFSLPPEMQQSSPLVPALQSNWLMMHVTVMILSYAALILGSLLSIGFLVITGGKETNLVNNSSFSLYERNPFPQFQKGDELINSNSLQKSPLLLSRAPLRPLRAEPFRVLRGAGSFPAEKKVRALEATRGGPEGSLTLSIALDNLSYRILGIGFPLLTIGILSGAVWANEAWGSYWSWDPKETWALLTWLVFAIYLHTRLTKGWEGKKPALIASLGFITVWVCYLGVNLIGEGLHSYGWL